MLIITWQRYVMCPLGRCAMMRVSKSGWCCLWHADLRHAQVTSLCVHACYMPQGGIAFKLDIGTGTFNAQGECVSQSTIIDTQRGLRIVLNVHIQSAVGSH